MSAELLPTCTCGKPMRHVRYSYLYVCDNQACPYHGECFEIYQLENREESEGLAATNRPEPTTDTTRDAMRDAGRIK